MTAELSLVKPAEQATDLTAIERVVVTGDLSKLTPDERWSYYRGVCQSVGLNPFTKPFEYITLSGKLTLYATKGAADQLRRRYGVSIGKPEVQINDGLCMVSVIATDTSGRTDSELGIVPIENLRGDAKANAILKAITKAKRRVTLSMCGLGMLDETEAETIPGARYEDADSLHGAALPAPSPISTTNDVRDAAILTGANPGKPKPAGAEFRQKWDQQWARGCEAARSVGLAEPEAQPASASEVELKKAARELAEQVENRRKLNAELLDKTAQVKAAHGEDAVADVDPATVDDTEIHEMLSALNEMLDAVPDEEAF